MSKEYWILKSPSIDHDGTIADSRTSVTNEFNKTYKTNYKVAELNHWNAVKDWCNEIGKSDDEANEIEHNLWYTPDALLKAEPIPGAIEFLRELFIRKINFTINSSRIPELRESTIAWYQKYAPFIEPENIKTGMPDIDGLVTKVNRINAVRSAIHIEDVPEHARSVLKYTHAYVILMSNRDDLGSLDLSEPELKRLIRIKGENGDMPNFWPIHKLLFG
mgnify:FL=1